MRPCRLRVSPLLLLLLLMYRYTMLRMLVLRLMMRMALLPRQRPRHFLPHRALRLELNLHARRHQL